MTLQRAGPSGDRPAGQSTLREERVIADLTTPTVSLGGTHDAPSKFQKGDGSEAAFRHLVLLQVEIDAPQLTDTDTATVTLYRASRRDATDLIARYEGVSQIDDDWKAIFSDQLIEYFDQQNESQIYTRVFNEGGNSAASTFRLTITARAI